MSQSSPEIRATGEGAGNGPDPDDPDAPDVPEEGVTSDQVLHAQEESKAEGDRDEGG
jgi:hypothetical protein